MGTVCDYDRVQKYRDLKAINRKIEALEDIILGLDDLEKRAIYSAKRYALRLACANLRERLRAE